MIASIEPINSGFAITDHKDPRARFYLALRERFGKFLHEASVSLRQQGEENTVDAVYLLVCSDTINSERLLTIMQIQSIRTHMLDYGDNKDR